jgi:hypothetical protein
VIPRSGASEMGMVLSTATNLLRMLNSGAADISGALEGVHRV